MFQTKVVKKIGIHILCLVTSFRKSCYLSDNVKKYVSAGKATENNMAHAPYLLDN